MADRGGRTRVVHRSHIGPLVIQRAFYPESAARPPDTLPAPMTSTAGAIPMSEPCHLYLIHPPGGLASGDTVELNAVIDTGAHALLTTPAAGKFYRRGSAGMARLNQHFQVTGGTLEWLPQGNIFYPDAAAELSSVIRLCGESRFVGWEIGCFGRPASDLTLGSGEIRQRLELWLDEKPLLLERLSIGAASLSARWGLQNHSSMGTWIGFPAGPSQLSAARAVVAVASCAGVGVACTLVDNVLICRALASRADHLKRTFVALWCALRPEFTGRQAVAPRVWAT